MQERRDLIAWLETLWPLVVPPAFGALIAARWEKAGAAPRPEDSKPTRPRRADLVFSWFCSMGLGIFFGPAVGEHFQLGDTQKMAGGFGIALIGLELIALVVAALRQWASDPVGTFARWRDALLGRRNP
jgi:hypothetical protein